MATPAPDSDLAAIHNCQTPGCTRPFDVITFRVGDSMAQWLCLPCWVSFSMAVIQQLADSGAIQLDDSAAAAEGLVTPRT